MARFKVTMIIEGDLDEILDSVHTKYADDEHSGDTT